jgi:hypothetical protein
LDNTATLVVVELELVLLVLLLLLDDVVDELGLELELEEVWEEALVLLDVDEDEELVVVRDETEEELLVVDAALELELDVVLLVVFEKSYGPKVATAMASPNDFPAS